MKLVNTSGMKEGELPAAESCALDEDEEEDVQFFNGSDKKSYGKHQRLMVGICWFFCYHLMCLEVEAEADTGTWE